MATYEDVKDWLERMASRRVPAPVQTHYENALRELGYARIEEHRGQVNRSVKIARMKRKVGKP